MEPVEQAAERIVRARHRRRLVIAFSIALVVVLLTSWLWTWEPAHAAAPPASVSVEASGTLVYVTHSPAGCYGWVAGWIQLPVSCARHALPAWFKRSVGGTVTGCLMGLAFTPGGMVAGCVGGLAGSIKWD